MRFTLVLGVTLFGLSSVGRAAAEGAATQTRPFEIGISSGYSAVGFGGRLRPADIETLWAVPLFVALDYRISKHWSVGGYGEMGFIDTSADDVEDAEESIRGHHYRVGAEAIYHSSPERRVQPWFGVGLGYDALRATYRIRSTYPPSGARPDPGTSSPVRASGFELGHAQLGIDFALVPWLAFGPFFGGSVVSYGHRRGIEPSDGFNVWSNIGLRATLRL